MYVCVCRAVTEKMLSDLVENGGRSYRDAREQLGLGTCCGRCVPEAKQYLSQEIATIAARISIAA